MQTLLAFAFAGHVPRERVERLTARGLDRLESWYGPRWGEPPRRNAARDGSRGLHLWSSPTEGCRWPAWVDRAGATTASLHVPLGFEAVTGPVSPRDAPTELTRRVLERPAEVMRLAPPFVLARLDPAAQTLTLLTDGLGLGRLFAAATPSVMVWSNRPLAALFFAGVRAEPDRLAWQRIAACDWAMGDRTAYAGVRAVPAGTRVVAGARGHVEESLDVLDRLAGSRGDPLHVASLDETAAALVEVARETGRLWPDPPVLSLSGGRDSRLVAAAFVAAGVDVRLRTYAAAAGEADTARRLVAALPRSVAHEVSVPAAQRPAARRQDGALARARRWHDLAEGLRPAVYLRNNAPRALPRQRSLLVSGVGGEFGHAPGYPADVQRLERLPEATRLDAFVASLTAKVVLPRGLSPKAVRAVERQTRAVVEHARGRGVTDAKVLDWYYADERLRRWGMAGEASGKVMPLLAPAFVGAAFGLSTAQSLDSALHTALISRLVPQWAGIAYFTATLRERQAVRQQALWEEDDVDLLAAVMADLDEGGGDFDPAQVRSIWRRAVAGRAAARDELLLQRVVWRAAFTDHLAAVNREPAATRLPVRVRTAVPTARARSWTTPVHALAVAANELGWARRLARTRLGRRLRRWVGV